MARCPCCKTQLDQVQYERVPIYNCGKCGGYWLDKMRLDVILERREVTMTEPVREKLLKIAADSNTKERLWCIPCGTEMKKEQFKYWSDIEIDRCPKCNGLWFDRGELEKCQIYWEYLQDNPDTFKDVDVMGKKAMIEAELATRRATNKNVRDNAGRPRVMREGSVSGVPLKDLSGVHKLRSEDMAAWKEVKPEPKRESFLGLLSRILGR